MELIIKKFLQEVADYFGDFQESIGCVHNIQFMTILHILYWRTESGVRFSEEFHRRVTATCNI